MNRPSGNANYISAKLSFFTCVTIIGITSILLLVPSFSGYSVFSKGEFAYPESLGFIFGYIALYAVCIYFFFKRVFIKWKLSKISQKILIAGIIALSIFLLLIVVSLSWIRAEVKRECQNAKRTYGGDCVTSLVSQLDDKKQQIKSRNNAIYALGQLADKRALPVLKKYYTGNIPQREPLHQAISQYELKKAITWCRRGNVTSWLYIDQSHW